MSYERETEQEKKKRFIPYFILGNAAELAIDMQNDCSRTDQMILPLYFVILDELCTRQGSDIDLSEIPKLFEQKYGYKLQLYDKLWHILMREAFKEICSINPDGPPRKISPSPKFYRMLRLDYQLDDITDRKLKEVSDKLNVANEKIAQLEKTNEARPADKLIKMMSDELTCVVCLDTLNEAVESECCKTLCCQNCSTSLLICPICRRKDVHWQSNEAIRRLVGKTPVKCDTKECTSWSTRAEVKQHKEHCEYVEIKCTNKDCAFTAKRKDFKSHVDKCQFAVVNCKHCQQQIMKKNAESHESLCAERTVKCTVFGCSITLKAKDLPQHLEACDFVALRCTNDNCNCTVQRQFMKDHLSKCAEGAAECMYCKYKFKRKSLHYHERGCATNYTECWFCQEYIRKRDIRVHGENCPQAPIRCRNPGCLERNRPSDMDKHVRDECEWTNVDCRWNGCDQQLIRKAVHQHESTCWHRDVTCHHCGFETSRTALDSHLRVCRRRRRYSPY